MIETLCSVYGVNEEQAEALDISINTALRAGAGSGKTRVLTSRYLRLLTDKPDIELDQIVAITFTRKAASEMKERIRQAIAARTEQSENEEDRARWNYLRVLMSSANIDTIHGFCGRLLRDNFECIGLDPAFEVMEEADSRTKLAELADEAINEYLEDEENSEPLDLVMSCYGSGLFRSGELSEGIIRLYKSIREKGASVNEAEIRTSARVCGEDDCGSSTDSASELELMAVKLLHGLNAKYEEFKQKENLLDFNDMEILADRLLDSNEIRSRYLERYRYFLVDEFQDVNPIQKRILFKLCYEGDRLPEGRLFIVGDHKQSIYGFRGTDYRIFDEVCEVIGSEGNRNLSNCYRSTGCIIDTVNKIFDKLLEPYERLNYPGENTDTGIKVELITWDKTDTEKSSKKRWEEIKKLLPDDSKAELLSAKLREHTDIGRDRNKSDYQGDILAGRIKRLVGNEGFDYKDIAILMRSRSGLEAIENSLQSIGIPYCVLGGIGFWGKQEIVDITALYKLVFDSEDLIALMTVLRSPIFGFSDDMLFKLAEIHPSIGANDMLSAIGALAESATGKASEVARRTENILQRISKLDGIRNAYELMKLLCQETSYPEIILALPDGTRKYRNLEKLMTIVRDFENKGIYSPMELPAYLSVLEENSGMDSEAFLDTEDSDAVKILTIHASKGLEFEAVFIPNMDKQTDRRSKSDKPLFYYSLEEGIIAAALDDEGKKKPELNPLYCKEYENMLKRENEDSRRIFYVAATRAKRYLAFVGTEQEATGEEEPMELNTFMKQLTWAMALDGSVDTIERANGSDLIDQKKADSKYQPEIPEKVEAYLDKARGNGSSIDLPMLGPVKTSPKGNISISMYMKYLDCPRGFYLRHIAGINPVVEMEADQDQVAVTLADDVDLPAKIDAASKGSMVHRILENLELKDTSDGEIERCIAAAEAFISAGGEEYSEIAEDIRRYVRNYIEIEKQIIPGRISRFIKNLHEFGFRIPLSPSLVLNGAVDRIDLYENDGSIEAYIVDFKTNRIRCDEDIEKKAEYYRRQICAYVKAVEGLPVVDGRKPVVKGIYLYFLDCGKYKEYEQEEVDVDRLMRELEKDKEMLLGLHALEEYGKCEGDSCGWCGYDSICRLI